MRTAFLLLAMGYWATGLAQRNTLATGSDASSASGRISYSIGQVDYSQQSTSGGTVAQGVQQPIEWLVLAMNEPLSPGLELSLGPNPTAGQITINLSGAGASSISFALLTADGHLVQEGPLLSASTSLSLHGMANGSYLLQLLEDGLPVQVLQLIKH